MTAAVDGSALRPASLLEVVAERGGRSAGTYISVSHAGEVNMQA